MLVRIAFDRSNPFIFKEKGHHKGDLSLLAEEKGFVCIFAPIGAKIIVWLGLALAGGAHPRRI